MLRFHRKEGRTLAKRLEFRYFSAYYFLNCAMQFVEIQGCGHDRVVVGFTTTLFCTCAIIAYHGIHHYSCEFESSSGEAYSIQHYVIKFFSDLRQVSGFFQVLRLRFPPPIKMTATI